MVFLTWTNSVTGKNVKNNVLYVIKQSLKKFLISPVCGLPFTSFSQQTIKKPAENTKGFGYIRCSWGQPDIHRAAYSNIQRQTWGGEREDKACSQRGRGEKVKDMLAHARKEAVGTHCRGMCHSQHIRKLCKNTATAIVGEKNSLDLFFFLLKWHFYKKLLMFFRHVTLLSWCWFFLILSIWLLCGHVGSMRNKLQRLIGLLQSFSFTRWKCPFSFIVPPI